MTLAWMLYAVAVAAALTLAAHAAEAALRTAGRPGRWPWLAALAGSWILPLRALVDRGTDAAPPPVPAVDALSLRSVAETTPVEPGALARVTEALVGAWTATSDALGGAAGALLDALPLPGPTTAAVLEAWAPTAWLVTAGAALGVVGAGALLLARRSRRWPERRVLGRTVRVSPGFGPAVIGVLRPRIVLPRWSLSLGSAELALVVEHEAEHARARDTLLLAAGVLATLAAPWNPVLWWQLRRLHLAVEMDCDRRVIERGTAPRRYGALLVAIGERVGRVGLPAAALAERRSFLERRLTMIVTTGSRRFGWRSGLGAFAALALVAVACEAPAPTDVAPTGPPEAADAVAAETPDEAKKGTVTARFQAVEIPDHPLIVIDGVIVADKGLADIEALEVESIEVVKGDAARTIYGERAANGVVHVTTRKGDAAVEDEASARATFEVEEVQGAGTLRAVRPDTPMPAVFVDGEPWTGDLRRLAEELDVASIEVLKGEAAAAFLAERGMEVDERSVIRVTTRR